MSNHKSLEKKKKNNNNNSKEINSQIRNRESWRLRNLPFDKILYDDIKEMIQEIVQ